MRIHLLRVLALISWIFASSQVGCVAPGRARELPERAREVLAQAPGEYAGNSGFQVSEESAHARAVFEGALSPEQRAGMEHEPSLDRVAMVAAGYPSREYDEYHIRTDSVHEYVQMRLLHPATRRHLTTFDEMILGVGVTPRAPDSSGHVQYEVVEYSIVPAPRP